MDSDRLKHLEFVQGAISRMAANSFLLKGWAVTFVAGLSALADREARTDVVWMAILGAVLFWGLDAYYLALERRFRLLYRDVASGQGATDFAMEVRRYRKGEGAWVRGLTSASTVLLYGGLIVCSIALQLILG